MAITDGLRIFHMRDAARNIIKHSSGLKRRDFDEDEIIQLALTRLVEILGEAAANVSPSTRERYPKIPWQDIADTRHKLVHGYFKIKLGVLWKIISKDVPAVLPALEAAADEAEP